jgi:nucleotide-binding universal stress UspA family protein
MFEKVLVCLDNSPESEEILPYIYSEGRSFSKIVFITVVHMSVIDLPIGVPGEKLQAVQTKAMANDFKRRLAEAPLYLEAKAKLLQEQGIDVETVVLEGVPAPTIVDYIKENGITLLALATHGHSGFREIALGSTAEFLLHNAGIPVMLITPKKSKGKKGK